MPISSIEDLDDVADRLDDLDAAMQASAEAMRTGFDTQYEPTGATFS
jgi:hypothetical protein